MFYVEHEPVKRKLQAKHVILIPQITFKFLVKVDGMRIIGQFWP